jgi:hypothetical protein
MLLVKSVLLLSIQSVDADGNKIKKKIKMKGGKKYEYIYGKC